MNNLEWEYQCTVEYLFSKLPFFSRDGQKALKYSLEKISLLMAEIGNPHEKFKSIHIAGTNGKGSVSHSLAAVLQANDYKTALYTSPHLTDFRERMRVNGQMIPKSFVVEFIQKHKELIEELHPSFFELSQAIAFSWFASQNIDVAVIETGLGGRLDSTNIIKPQLSVITNISFDHTDILGDTLEKIAIEKAGIIKPHTPVVIGRYQPDIHFVFENKAKSLESHLYKSGDFNMTENVDFQLKGIYQQENIRTIWAALQVLVNNCGYLFSIVKIKEALSHVKELTGLRGRWDILREDSPKIIADTGHNEDGIKQVVNQLNEEQFNKLHFVIGMMVDKKREKIWDLLPKDALYYFCRPNVPRGMDANELMQEGMSKGLQGACFASCHAALQSAINNANDYDLIFIGGSTFVVADLIESPLIIKTYG
ncbi:MAG: bifunctional folylpolyglutamate synthase/dihydrofolate synthase [Bacteroidia bacterium]|nr:bifunctional folylpolyglutamate synthase/dihydrofolate synthase [Bacteroidia bacterium]MCO5254712.1 Mur ligase family protein [Bacteroidota bacterium]